MPTDRLEGGTHRRGSPAAVGTYCIRPPRTTSMQAFICRSGWQRHDSRALATSDGCRARVLAAQRAYAIRPYMCGGVAPDTEISYRVTWARAGEMPCVRARNDRRCGWLLGLCARQSQSAHQSTPWPRPHSRIQQRQYLADQPLQLTKLVPTCDPHRHFVKAHVLEHPQMFGALLRRPGRRP